MNVNDSQPRYDQYVTGEKIRLGDRVAMRGFGDKLQTGRIVKHFLPGSVDIDAVNWGMENGGIMIECDQGGWIGYGPADEELFFVSRRDAGNGDFNDHQA